jgi:hypothetical protein
VTMRCAGAVALARCGVLRCSCHAHDNVFEGYMRHIWGIYTDLHELRLFTTRLEQAERRETAACRGLVSADPPSGVF